MKDTIRIDEIESYLKDGGDIDNILIETEPTDHKRVWSKVGKEIDQDEDKTHWWNYFRR